jgi:hypothetical protein
MNTCESTMRRGMTLRSAVGTTSVLVLRLGEVTHPPSVDGRVMVPGRPTPCSMRAQRDRWKSGPVAGRRYVDVMTGLMVLCTRSGPGCLSYDGRPMIAQGASPAPR